MNKEPFNSEEPFEVHWCRITITCKPGSRRIEVVAAVRLSVNGHDPRITTAVESTVGGALACAMWEGVAYFYPGLNPINAHHIFDVQVASDLLIKGFTQQIQDQLQVQQTLEKARSKEAEAAGKN